MEARTMNQPKVLMILAKDRHETYQREADQHRLARQATSIPRQTTRDRFRIRDLRWTMFRPTEA
jgi:hypothetical protein